VRPFECSTAGQGVGPYKGLVRSSWGQVIDYCPNLYHRSTIIRLLYITPRAYLEDYT
jgi:hypothetical protein